MTLNLRVSLGRWGQRIEDASFYVLFGLLPFSKASGEIRFGLLLLGGVLRRIDGKTRNETVWGSLVARPLLASVAAFLIICAVSVIVSSAPEISAKGFIGKWLEYLLLFLFAADAGSDKRRLKRFIGVFAFSACLVVIYGLGQEMMLQGNYRDIPLFNYHRVTGPYENPIDLATYLIVAVPLLLAFSFECRRVFRRMLWMLCIVLILCLLRTEASGAILGFLTALIFTGLLINSLRRKVLIVAGVVFIFAFLFLVYRGRLHDVLSWSEVGKQDRIVMWQAAVAMIQDEPFIGKGVNTFMYNYLRYWVGGEQQPRYAHNCYLQMAAETGIFGLAAFLCVLGNFMACLLNALRLAGKREPLLVGWFIGLTAFLTQAAIDTNFYSLKQSMLFWSMAGLAVGLSIAVQKDITKD